MALVLQADHKSPPPPSPSIHEQPARPKGYGQQLKAIKQQLRERGVHFEQKYSLQDLNCLLGRDQRGLLAYTNCTTKELERFIESRQRDLPIESLRRMVEIRRFTRDQCLNVLMEADVDWRFPYFGDSRLGPEVRLRILRCGLQHTEDGRPTWVWPAADRESDLDLLAVARTSRALRREALPLFFASNTFALDLTSQDKISKAKKWVFAMDEAGLKHLHRIILKRHSHKTGTECILLLRLGAGNHSITHDKTSECHGDCNIASVKAKVERIVRSFTHGKRDDALEMLHSTFEVLAMIALFLAAILVVLAIVSAIADRDSECDHNDDNWKWYDDDNDWGFNLFGSDAEHERPALQPQQQRLPAPEQANLNRPKTVAQMMTMIFEAAQ